MSVEVTTGTNPQNADVLDSEPPMPLDASQGYQSLVPNEQGWFWCETLGFWLGTWEGTIDRETAIWLRFYDRDSHLVLLPEEAAQQQAQQESQRAGRLAARLRELGEDPDAL